VSTGHCAKPTTKNQHHRRCRRAITLRVSYQLTAAARVAFTLKRRHAGRKVNGRCVKPAPKNHQHRRCTRLTRVSGQINQTAVAGANRFTFNGKVAGHKLSAGSYQLTATPSRGTPHNVRFKIVG
jgi:hypothetical protein